MRYLAIDYGLKRTGLAICDPSETITSPLVVIEGHKNLITRIVEIIRENEVDEIIVGLPINMDGTQGPQAKASTKFAKELEKVVTITVRLHDERLSSFAAEEKLADMEMTRKKKKKRLDAIAAANILQSYIESKDNP